MNEINYLEMVFNYCDITSLNIGHLKGVLGSLRCLDIALEKAGFTSFYDEVLCLQCCINVLEHVIEQIENDVDKLWEDIKND